VPGESTASGGHADTGSRRASDAVGAKYASSIHLSIADISSPVRPQDRAVGWHVSALVRTKLTAESGCVVPSQRATLRSHLHGRRGALPGHALPVPDI